MTVFSPFHRLLLAALVCLSLAGPGLAQSPQTPQTQQTPQPGTPERAAILDAIRPAIEAVMRGPVEFVVSTMVVQDGWAFVVADPQRPGGAPIDLAQTGLAGDQGFMDGQTVFALARQAEGSWHHVDDVIGPTDVAYAYWPEYFGAPAALFGLQ